MSRRGILRIDVTLSIAIAQLNPTVGDIAGNAALVRRARDTAASEGADLVVFSELVLVGYPPEDLVLRPALIAAAARVLSELESESASPGMPGIVVTAPWRDGDALRNAVALVADGRTELRYKHELPNYGVFDEKRVFVPGPLPEPVTFRGVRIGLPICEDIWFDRCTTHLARRGAELFLVPNGSPFEVEKFHQRLELARSRVSETGVPLVYINQVGGQDELVFDGGSFVLNADGTLAHLLPFWQESMQMTRWTRSDAGLRAETTAAWTEPLRLSAVYQAMMLGLRDYVRKNRFPGIVLGMSGGIDSALTAAVAVDALGPAQVRGVRLPSRFTSRGSLDDAQESARLLGMRLDTLPIEEPVRGVENVVASLFEGKPRDVTEENMQARIRGVLLMAISNKYGELLVTTGNKSEMSVGYATLYGDMAGGFAVLKDVYKGWVYRLVEWRNRREGRDLIPPAVLTRPPSAELRYEQRDDQSLPPYDVLDGILTAYVEEDLDADQLVRQGLPRPDVERIIRMVDLAEYKRRQAPPGIRISTKAFGRDRRMPITNRYRG